MEFTIQEVNRYVFVTASSTHAPLNAGVERQVREEGVARRLPLPDDELAPSRWRWRRCAEAKPQEEIGQRGRHGDRFCRRRNYGELELASQSEVQRKFSQVHSMYILVQWMIHSSLFILGISYFSHFVSKAFARFLQGYHSPCAKPPVDFNTKVPFWPCLP